MSVFFTSIAAQEAHIPLLAAWVIEGESAGAKALFAWKEGRYTGICRDEKFPARCADMLQEGARDQSGIIEWEHTRLFLEQVNQGRKLVICGAGHVSLSVIKIAVLLNYEVTVIDDRAFFTQKAEAAGAHHVICEPFREALEKIPGDDATAFVIMTREHACDVDCLRLILQKPRAYVGMMGSKSRTEQIRLLLSREGVDAAALRQTHMPIGLPIGSRTPEEIAVSVMAEVISVMNAADSGEGYPPGMLKELSALEAKFQQPSTAMETRVQEPKTASETRAQQPPTAVLAMIVEKHKEAPRRPGTKMLVKEDGSFLGTAGGGTAEALVLETAGRMLREGCQKSRLLHIILEKGAMYCGGELSVFLLPM